MNSCSTRSIFTSATINLFKNLGGEIWVKNQVAFQQVTCISINEFPDFLTYFLPEKLAEQVKPAVVNSLQKRTIALDIKQILFQHLILYHIIAVFLIASPFFQDGAFNQLSSIRLLSCCPLNIKLGDLNMRKYEEKNQECKESQDFHIDRLRVFVWLFHCPITLALY